MPETTLIKIPIRPRHGFRRSLRTIVALTCLALPIVTSAETPPETTPATDSIQEHGRTPLQIGLRAVDKHGRPVRDAVVLSSAGGEAITAEDGTALLSIGVDPDVERLRVSAAASSYGKDLLGSVEIRVPANARSIDAGDVPLIANSTCNPEWLPMFGGHPGSPDSVGAMVVFDDGNGPALYVAAGFGAIGGTHARNLARWDGERWVEVGGGTAGSIGALAVFDDGSGPALYVGGRFNYVGDLFFANNIARWDGEEWSRVESGVSVPHSGTGIHDLHVFDDGNGPALYVAGHFSRAGGQDAPNIAKWDGREWHPLGTGTSSTVRSLTVFDDGRGPALYVGGSFTFAGGEEANRVAVWREGEWAGLGGGVTGPGSLLVHALAVYNDGSGKALYAAGRFNIAGDVYAANIARWDGVRWHRLGMGLDGLWSTVETLTTHDDGRGEMLFAGGRFDTADGYLAHNVAAWDGQEWYPLGPGLDDRVRNMISLDIGEGRTLFAGGSFENSGDRTIDGIAQWDGDAWRAVGRGFDGPVHASTVFDDGDGPALYVAGEFITIDNEVFNHIARWDVHGWAPLGSGTDAPVFALEVFDYGLGPALYAGGRFTQAGGVDTNHIARWDGDRWSPLRSGTDDEVRSLLAFTDGTWPMLYVGGRFDTAGGFDAPLIAGWDGQSWSQIGSGSTQGLVVNTIAHYDDDLYIGGRLWTVGDVSVANIARWDHSSWSDVGGGIPSSSPISSPMLHDMAVYGEGESSALYVTGLFGAAGTISADHIAKWDGEAWAEVGGGLQRNHPSTGYSLATYHDGESEKLYVGGSFTSAGTVSAERIAQWDGEQWQPLGSGVDHNSGVPEVRTLQVYGHGPTPGLFVGGVFRFSPGGDSYLAIWQGCPRVPPCIADWNDDGEVDVNDFFAFLNDFADGDPRTDLNNDGEIDINDFFIFLQEFELGCD